MIAVALLGAGLGVLGAYLLLRLATRRANPMGSAGRTVALPDTTGSQRLHELRTRIEELHKLQRAATDRFDELQRLQRAATDRFDHGFEHLARELRTIASQLRPGREVEPSRVPAMTGAPEHARDPLPPAAGEMPRELSMPELVARWNALDWTGGSPEGPRALGRDLPADWRLSEAIRFKYVLLHRATSASPGGPMYLLPCLGKSMSLFNDDFFDGPDAGVAEQLIDAAEVEFHERHTTIEQELAKLMHASYSPADVLLVSKRGRLA
jgi:hypothetical protein